VNGTLKNELVYRTAYITRKAAMNDIARWIELRYNRTRLHSTLGQLTVSRGRNSRAVDCLTVNAVGESMKWPPVNFRHVPESASAKGRNPCACRWIGWRVIAVDCPAIMRR
jgi:hypothetical protein